MVAANTGSKAALCYNRDWGWHRCAIRYLRHNNMHTLALAYSHTYSFCLVRYNSELVLSLLRGHCSLIRINRRESDVRELTPSPPQILTTNQVSDKDAIGLAAGVPPP